MTELQMAEKELFELTQKVAALRRKSKPTADKTLSSEHAVAEVKESVN